MSTPLRARIAWLHQRVILQIRWWFRLPIDDVRDHQLKTALDGQQELLKALRSTLEMMKTMNARLRWHEHHIPRMRMLGRQFDQEQRKLAETQVPVVDMRETIDRIAREHGLVPMPSNGAPNS